MTSLNRSLIENRLKTDIIGRDIRIWDETNSTNELAKSFRNEPEGLTILANQQHFGRGRLGRSWHSPNELGVYLSILLKPQMDSKRIAPSTLMAGVAVIDAVRPSLINSIPLLKWPNDVLVNGLKLAGILCEYCPPDKTMEER